MSAEVVTLSPRPTAVIPATTTWREFAALWPRLLDEVWQAVRGHPQVQPGRNVMLYRDDVPRVEVGVEAAGPFDPLGRVVPSMLPAGRAVRIVHRGPYGGLGRSRELIVEACRERGLRRLGPRWEIYGHQPPDATDPEVELYHLVEDGPFAAPLRSPRPA